MTNLKLSHTKWCTTETVPLSALLFNIVLEFLVKATRKEQGIRESQIGKEEVKLSIFADEIIIFLCDPKNSTKMLEIINTLAKYHDTKLASGN
jgi:hypothetical protein